MRTLVSDFLASIVVFLVALPLCMGIAIASNLPPESGIVTGIIGGLVASALGGCRLQVSGPAAGLVVTIVDVVQRFGLEGFCLVVLLAGIIQMAAGLAGIAQWFRVVPPSVVNGMLTGIGIIIFAAQFHVMLDGRPGGQPVENLLGIPAAVAKVFTHRMVSSHDEAAIIGLLTVCTLILWEKFSRRWSGGKFVPSSLVAIVLASLAAAICAWPIKFISLPADLSCALHLVQPQQIAQLVFHPQWSLLGSALVVAFIASAETLLTASALDKFGARTNYDRELLAQGVGNTICGALGVLPMTGVMVRSGVNVAAGAKTRLSGVLHGLWLLLFALFLPALVHLIPGSSLAALLVFAGWKLANFKVAAELRQTSKYELFTYLMTVAVILGVDLLSGVAAGVALSLGRLIYTFAHLQISTLLDERRKVCYMSLRGSATFLSLPKLAQALETVPGDYELHVHLDGLNYIDHACLDLLMNWDAQHRAGGGNLVIDWSALGQVFRERRRELRLPTALTGNKKGTHL